MDRVIEYVTPADTSDLEILGIIGIGVGALLFVASIFLVMGENRERAIYAFFACAACILLGFMGYARPDVAAHEARVEMVEQTSRLYPSLTEEQAQNIWSNVPSGKPDDSFKVMSTVELPPEVGSGGSFTKREVSLVWNGEGYVLAQSVDGEKFEPLER